MTYSFDLVHPFSPSSINYSDDDVSRLQDYGIISAIRRLKHENGWNCTVHYITNKNKPFCIEYRNLCYQFHPRSFIWSNSAQLAARGIFGLEWSWSLAHYLLTSRRGFTCFFTVSGLTTKLLALISRLRSRQYAMIVGTGGGMPRSRTQNLLVQHALKILIHTELQRQRWHQQYGIPLSKMTVFPVGVDVSHFALKLNIGDSTQYPKLLFVGSIGQRKNLMGAMLAFAKIRQEFPEAQFTVIGPVADSAYQERVNTIVLENGLNQAVRFLGPIPNSDLPKYYREADLLLFPTLSESFGIVLVESMSCGTPPVCLRGSGGPDEIIIHNETGLLVSEEELAPETIRLLRDRERLQRMSLAARQRVEREYSEERNYVLLCQLLSEAGFMMK